MSEFYKDFYLPKIGKNKIVKTDLDGKLIGVSESELMPDYDGEFSQLEEKNIEQDTKISDLETKNTEQDTKISQLEEKNTEQDTKISEHDDKLSELETKNTSQDTKISKIDSRLNVAGQYRLSDGSSIIKGDTYRFLAPNNRTNSSGNYAKFELQFLPSNTLDLDYSPIEPEGFETESGYLGANLSYSLKDGAVSNSHLDSNLQDKISRVTLPTEKPENPVKGEMYYATDKVGGLFINYYNGASWKPLGSTVILNTEDYDDSGECFLIRNAGFAADEEVYFVKFHRDGNPTGNLKLAIGGSGPLSVYQQDGKLILSSEIKINSIMAFYVHKYTGGSATYYNVQCLGNVFHVEDSLTSTSTSNPLSAAQGKVLNDTLITLNTKVDSITIEEASTTEGYAKTYSLKINGEEKGVKINIPKDLVVKSGTVKSATEADQPYTGAIIGDKYIDLELNDSSSNHIYIPVKDLVDVYTGKDDTKIKVEVNGSNEIIATIKSGTIEKTDLTSGLQTEIDGKATQTELEELQGQVTTLESGLGNKVDNTTFQALQTQVTTLEETVSTQATTIQEQQTKITELESKLGDIQTILESINGTSEE